MFKIIQELIIFQKNEFISVELLDGYIVFKYTENNIMTSKFKYNNNRWVRLTVQASWNLRKGSYTCVGLVDLCVGLVDLCVGLVVYMLG